MSRPTPDGTGVAEHPPPPTGDPSRTTLEDGRPARRPTAGRMLLATAAGLVVALALPPWGFWPLSFVGVILFELALGATPTPAQRATYGLLFGTAWYYLGMAWMVQLTAPGYLVAGLAYGGYQACAELAVPPGRWNVIGRPAAHTLAETLRFAFPFGGVPLASMGIAQVAGPLAGLARIGGVILITWVVFQVGFVVGAIVREAWGRGWHAQATDAPAAPTPWVLETVPLVMVMALVVVAGLAPQGSATGETLRVAAVQGGGEQGTTALEVPSRLVTERHLAATASIAPDPDLDLVLWPENTIDVVSFEDSDAYRAVAAQAARLGVPIAVGVTEDTDDGTRFTNAEVVVAPTGEIVARYDKVRRVPFGEYVPLRGVLEALGAPVDRIGRDAVAGTAPAYVELPDGVGLAVVISWEVFFGGRAREGVRAGGEAILNPTNGASYTGTIVQTQQVASSRLRSIENGRWTVQAAPTGFTAVVDADGRVLQRSSISERTVLYADVELRDGLTWYTNIGDAPIIVAAFAVYLLALVAELRRRRRELDRRHPGRRDLDREGDRAVVDQLDAHLRSEAAGGDRGAGGA